MLKVLLLSSVLLISGCAGTALSGSGVTYNFTHEITKESSICTVKINKAGKDSSLDAGKAKIQSTGTACKAEGGIEGSIITGKERSELESIVTSVIEKFIPLPLTKSIDSVVIP